MPASSPVRWLVSFDEHDKRNFVERYCIARSIPMEHCIAIGDSRSDIPLFGAVGFSIALNATPDARAVATVAIDTDDLADILTLIPARPGGITARAV